jgi:hypothetical protein
MRFQLKTKILWLGFGGLFELHDDIVAVTLRKLGLAHQRVSLFLELERRLPTFPASIGSS